MPSRWPGRSYRNAIDLDEAAVIETARTRGQDHLLAIAERRTITEAIPGILLERGNDEVALKTVRTGI